MTSTTPQPKVIPWPVSIKPGEGTMTLRADSRIVIGQTELTPLANVLSEEIHVLAGLRLSLAEGTARPGDIALVLDDSLAGEAHAVEIAETAAVRGGDYAAVVDGSATLLQLLADAGGRALPRLAIADKPHVPYRGLMIDLARKWHSVETLKQIVILCRWYKIRYLQVHLTDHPSFTFPSTAFPKLPTPGQHYTLDELRELVAFADARGVTIVPELETPGHASAAARAMPEVFDSIDPATGEARDLWVMNMANESLYETLDVLIGEMCDVFASSPYFHIGCDEVRLTKVGETPEAKAYMAKHGLADETDLYLKHIVRMHELVKRHGRQTVLWEGFAGTGSQRVTIPDDILVIAWETMYQTPDSLLDNGYTIFSCAWQPLYVAGTSRWSPEHIFGWNLYRWEHFYVYAPAVDPIQIEPTDRLIGAQMCAWEQPEQLELRSLRKRLAAMAERIWNPVAGRTWADFAARLDAIDYGLDRIMYPFVAEVAGLTDGDYEGPEFEREIGFTESVTVTLTPVRDGLTLRYTLDESEPTTESQSYDEPLVFVDNVSIKVRAFDAAGEPAGRRWWGRYELHAIAGEVDGLITHIEELWPNRPPTMFVDTATVTLTASGGAIHYNMGRIGPTVESPVYKEPLAITDTTDVTAQLFDAAGDPRGVPWTRQFNKVDFGPNLTKGKPATASRGVGMVNGPEKAVDGLVGRDQFWQSGPAPAWWQVDLGEVVTLNAIHVFPRWDGDEAHQYTVEVSTDGEAWTERIDMRANADPATPEGHRHGFPPTPARHIRLRTHGDSTDPGLRLTELRAFEAK